MAAIEEDCCGIEPPRMEGRCLMPDTTFNLHWYDGPAHINGVEFTTARVSEHADSDGPGIIKGWEGTASVPRRSAPTVTGAALHDDNGRERWSVDFSGIGPSPWVKDGS